MKAVTKKKAFPIVKESPKEKCPNCNKLIKYENSNYCTNCGHKLITPSQE